MSKTTQQKLTNSAIGLVAMFAALVAANYIIGSLRCRLDLTEDKLYSLSNGSRAILANLDRPVTLKLFFSRSTHGVPTQLKDYIDKVDDLLAEYREASGGKLQVEVYDTKEDSDAEEWAQQYGLPSQPIPPYGARLYMGLVAVAGSTDAILPALDPSAEPLLEYHITKMIYQVTHPRKPSLGVLSSMQVMGGFEPDPASPMGGKPTPPWLVFKELQANYDVRTVPPTTESIDPSIETLVVVHPKELGEKALYAIDQFVLRGGKLLVFVDPLSVTDIQQSKEKTQYGMPPNSSSDLKKLFAAWGLGYESSMVLADQKAASPVRISETEARPNPGWLTLTANSLDSKDVLAAGLNALSIPFAGSLNLQNLASNLTATPIISSSPDSGVVGSYSVLSGQPLQPLFKPGGTSLVVAARIEGTFTTAFPNGPTPAEGETNALALPAGHLAEGKSSVLVMADTDILFHGFAIQEVPTGFGFSFQQPMNDNLNLVINAVEQMAGSLDLITVRCRNSFARHFDRVVALQNAAATQWSEEERRLQESQREIQRQLAELQSKKDESQRFILSDEQKKAIADYQAQEREINLKLRQVKKNLTRDIDRLGMNVKTINILLMPCAVILAGVVVSMRRRNGRS